MVLEQPGRIGEAILQRRHANAGLQRILRRDQPPHIIEAELFQRHLADMQMTLMGRIERAAEKADAQTRRDGTRRPDPGEWLACAFHGRVCPVPRTIYLNVVSCSTPTG